MFRVTEVTKCPELQRLLNVQNYTGNKMFRMTEVTKCS